MKTGKNLTTPQNSTGKHILLITHFLPPSHTAGTEQYTLGLGKAMKARGYDVELMCAEDWDNGKKYWNGVTKDSIDGLPTYRVHLDWLKAGNPNEVLYDSNRVEKWLDDFFQSNRFDLVHVTSAYSLGVGIFRSVKRAKIPLVLSLMDFWFLCPSIQLLRSDGELCDGNTTPWQCEACLMADSNIFHKLQKISMPEPIKAQFWDMLSHSNFFTRQRGLRGMLLDMSQRKDVMKEAFALPDLVISPSKIVQTMFSKNMDRPVEFLPYRHDVSWLENYDGKTKSDIIRIGYLGQIQKIKGVHLLVDAFVKADIENQARLDLWGDYSKNPAYVQSLRELIGDSQSITLHGGYKREQLGSILADMNIVVVPSIWYENAPLVIQEAIAAKTPVITTNVGGMSEAVTHDVNGLLFERNDSDDLARQIKRLVDENDLLEKLTSGIPSVKKFQIDSNDPIEMELIYNRLIAENQSASV